MFVKKKDDKLIPKFSKAIADRYINEAGNIFSRFEQLERNKLHLQKIRTNGIDQGILLFDNHAQQERLEKRHKILLAFTTPNIIKGKKVWNLGGGLNPFLAMYMNSHKYEIKKPTWRVRKCLN
jgi:hypothetical protein